MFTIEITDRAKRELARLKDSPAEEARFKAVSKAIRILGANPRSPGLNTHQFHSRKCPHDDKLWEAYAQNNTPGAYRIFFCYVPDRPRVILIVDITDHP